VEGVQQRKLVELRCDQSESPCSCVAGLAAIPADEILNSKRVSRERLIRAIALEHPELARSLQMQTPVAGTGGLNFAPPKDPLGDILREHLHQIAAGPCECGFGVEAAN